MRDTPFGYTLSLISGKWKMTILYWLVEVSPVSPKVEYSLSEKGKSLYPVMEEICKWGEAHWEE